LRDGCLDAIFSNSTLDHFPRMEDLEAGLRELGRCLKPGGLFLLTLDNPLNPVVGARNALPRKLTDTLRITPYSVGRTLSLRGAKRMLERLGFTIEDGGALAHPQRFLAIHSLRRLERRSAPRACEHALAFLHWQERLLRRLPTSQLTGHFIWVKARKKTSLTG
jgi:SAM-dependent methyltransferase